MRMSRMSIAVVLELNFDISYMCKLRLPPNVKTGENCTSGLKLSLEDTLEKVER